MCIKHSNNLYRLIEARVKENYKLCLFNINISKQMTTADIRSDRLMAFNNRSSKHSYGVTRGLRYPASCEIIRKHNAL
jgi:hypothetical protein